MSVGNSIEGVITSVKISNDVSIGNITERVTVSAEVISDVATIK